MIIDHINLSQYKNQINLETPFQVKRNSLDRFEREKIVDTLLNELSSELSRLIGKIQINNYTEKRRILHAIINTIPSFRLNKNYQNLLDSLLQAELSEKEIKKSEDIEVVKKVGNTQIGLWKGDITCLEVDAVVNAANSQLLGCFQPLHACIDNAIHTAAGVQLRDDCQKIMEIQGIKESTGIAKITRAYNLPSNYVLHTVGPIVNNTLTIQHEEMLSHCYKSCLDLSTEISSIKSVAFCCISTGVFGYPQEDAAAVAVNSVTKWLAQHDHNLEKIIFNVFLEKDLNIYHKILT